MIDEPTDVWLLMISLANRMMDMTPSSPQRADLRTSMCDLRGLRNIAKGVPMALIDPASGYVIEPEPDAPGCAYVHHAGSYTRAPDYCDLDAEPGSEYCAAHRAVEDGYSDTDLSET